MPIYLLGARTPSITIPNQTLSIAITGSVDKAYLYVDAGKDQNLVRISPQMVLIPAITSELTVGVKPIGTETFRHETIIHLSAGPDSPGALDPIQVAFDPVNVSGCQAMELAALTPRGARVEVLVRGAADVPLRQLASMARTAARRNAGVRAPSSGGSLSIGVDASASMKAAFADGSVAAAVDMLVGVADVAGIREISATLVGAHGVPVDAAAPDLAQALSTSPARWSAGARWSVLPDGDRAMVVSDHVNHGTNRLLPTLCISDNYRLRAVAPLLAPPPPGVTAEDNLTANTALIDDLAGALLPRLT
ncbi:hypothetical protein [Mycobacterium intracellulare]|nr:hypothetical protein [Mycobacterium intracellulare]